MGFEQAHLFESFSRPWNRCFPEPSIFLHVRLIMVGWFHGIAPRAYQRLRVQDVGDEYGILGFSVLGI